MCRGCRSGLKKNGGLYWPENMNWNGSMEKSERTYWAVYAHEEKLNIWRNGELVGEIPQSEFPALILEMAQALRNKAAQREEL